MLEPQVDDDIVDLLWLNRLHRVDHGNGLLLRRIKSAATLAALSEVILSFVVKELARFVAVLLHSLLKARRVKIQIYEAELTWALQLLDVIVHFAHLGYGGRLADRFLCLW